MRQWAVLAAALLVAAAQARADDRALLLDAVRANGCAMTDAEGDRLLPPLGLTRERARAVVDGLALAGLATVADGRVVLAPVVCAGSDEAAGGALSALVAFAAGHGCAPDMGEMAAALGPLGISKVEIAALAGRLAEAGEATVEGAALVLVPGLCRPLMPPSPSMDVRRRVAAAEWVEARLATAPGCAMRRGALAGEGVAVGIGPADLETALSDLAGRGRLARPVAGTVALGGCAP